MAGNEHHSRADLAVSRGSGPESAARHGSVVAWDDDGVLILGASGAGKSGLALRLMALGASLVADDRVVLSREEGDLVARAPEPLRGLVEARGVGILRVPHAETARIRLAVDLDIAPEARMPEPRKITLLGCDIRLICGRGVPNLDAIITVVAQKRADVI